MNINMHVIITFDILVLEDFLLVAKQVVIHEGLLHLVRYEWLRYLFKILSVFEVDEYVEFVTAVLLILVVLLVSF